MITVAHTTISQAPARVDVGRFDLTKSGRTASGRMAMDIVRAGVRRVDVTWEYLPDEDLKTLLDVIAANKPFFQLRYPDAGQEETMQAYVGDIMTSLWHTIGGVRYWKSVELSFIEQ